MARFLMTVWPFVGCLYPFISVAQQLRADGHEVAFYGGEASRELLKGEGFELFPFEHVPEQRVWDLIVAGENGSTTLWSSPRVAYRTFRDWLAGTVEAQVADLEPLLDSFNPAVVVTEPSMWAPLLILREKRATRVALLSSLTGCLIPGPDAPPWGPGLPPPRNRRTRLISDIVERLVEVGGRRLRRQVNGIRARYGLPVLDCNMNALLARAPLYLIPSIPELDYNRTDLPPSVRYVGPCVWNKPSTAQTPDWLEALPGKRPVVHVTEGSLHYQKPFLLKAAMAGLGNQDMDVILTTGPHREPGALELGPRASNVRVEGWVSHSELLPRCSALVTTGGAGTIMSSLQAGVPMVIVPTHWDKPDNARRVVDVGAGVRLQPWQCTPERLARAVQRVLTEPSFKQSAERIRRQLSQTAGPPAAADLLAGLASSGEAGAPMDELVVSMPASSAWRRQG